MGYTHLLKPEGNRDPGMTDILIGIFDEFSSIKKPVAPFTNPGDSQRITETHEFKVGTGFYRVYQIPEKHDGKGDAVGSIGSTTLANEFKIFIPGINAESLEFVKKLLNEQVITLHRDSDCDNEQWLQLGSHCKPARISASYTTGTIEPNGEKGFILMVKWAGIPYVYGGTISIYEAES